MPCVEEALRQSAALNPIERPRSRHGRSRGLTRCRPLAESEAVGSKTGATDDTLFDLVRVESMLLAAAIA